jgi:hypothetical protein
VFVPGRPFQSGVMFASKAGLGAVFTTLHVTYEWA